MSELPADLADDRGDMYLGVGVDPDRDRVVDLGSFCDDAHLVHLVHTGWDGTHEPERADTTVMGA